MLVPVLTIDEGRPARGFTGGQLYAGLHTDAALTNLLEDRRPLPAHDNMEVPAAAIRLNGRLYAVALPADDLDLRGSVLAIRVSGRNSGDAASGE